MYNCYKSSKKSLDHNPLELELGFESQSTAVALAIMIPGFELNGGPSGSEIKKAFYFLRAF